MKKFNKWFEDNQEDIYFVGTMLSMFVMGAWVSGIVNSLQVGRGITRGHDAGIIKFFTKEGTELVDMKDGMNYLLKWAQKN